MRDFIAAVLFVALLYFLFLTWTLFGFSIPTAYKSVTTGKCVYVDDGRRCDQLPIIHHVRPVR